MNFIDSLNFAIEKENARRADAGLPPTDVKIKFNDEMKEARENLANITEIKKRYLFTHDTPKQGPFPLEYVKKGKMVEMWHDEKTYTLNEVKAHANEAIKYFKSIAEDLEPGWHYILVHEWDDSAYCNFGKEVFRKRFKINNIQMANKAIASLEQNHGK